MISDHFDTYSINFSLYHPLKVGESMQISGDAIELGQWDEGSGPIQMNLSQKEVTWINGENVKPHTTTVKFCQGEDPVKINYKYLIATSEGTKIFERDPKRTFEILDPSEYRGELGI